MRCCLLRRESRSKEKSDHSSRGGKEMVWRSVKRTASMTRSPRASEGPKLRLEAPLVVRTMWGGGEKSMACRCSMMPFQITCWNSAGIFILDRSCSACPSLIGRYLEMLLSMGYGGGGVQWEEGARGSGGCRA
ncbi:hypothetical protein EYF80_062524 [Liparis tanakae]|uniref:Uncharacterized protein n=1 Tax=Liparis tanakae TaxID=230148 RepID=A0A4Z2EF53_9TELE|nr:hypothetical protein EYF80_062524 [Liparis tanakae]